MINKVISFIAILSLSVFLFLHHDHKYPGQLRRQLRFFDPRTTDKKMDTSDSLLHLPQAEDNSIITTNGGNNTAASRVIVLTVWSHYPELLELHVASLSTFLRSEKIEYICVLNSPFPEVNDQLRATAERLPSVTHFTVSQRESPYDPSRHHANALDQALHDFLLSPESLIQIQSNDILFLLDSDMFLLQPTSVEEVLEHGQYSIATMVQVRKGKNTKLASPMNDNPKENNKQQSPVQLEYLWPNLAVLQFSNSQIYHELGFYPQRLQVTNEEWLNLDTGGASHTVFARFKQENRIRGMRAMVECSIPRNNNNQKVIEQLQSDNWDWYQTQQSNPDIPQNCASPILVGYHNDCRNVVYHLGSAGSNWRHCPEDYLQQQRTELQQHLQKQMQQYKEYNSNNNNNNNGVGTVSLVQ